MITFIRHSIDRPKDKIVENIPVNDKWTIFSCQYASTGGGIISGLAAREVNAHTNEYAISCNFVVILKHSNSDRDRKLDMYAINILYPDSNTKKVNRQTIRYYTMYSSKSYDNIKGDVSFLTHLKMSLSNGDLDKLFPYDFVK
jgi:hypothetical protein